MQIGDVELSNCMVEVLEKASLKDADGLIGMDIFQHLLVTLDYPRAELRLDALPARPALPLASGSEDKTNDLTGPQDHYIAPEMKDWLHMFRVGHQILLMGSVQGRGERLLMMDTGASQSLLNSVDLSSGLQEVPHAEIKGISGAVKQVYVVSGARLRFGSLILPPTTLPAIDLTAISHNTGTEISGIVGLPTLSRLSISIDYRDNLIKLDYAPQHDPAQKH